MAEDKKKDLFKEQFDGEYMGNIWGWKVSFIGLGVILFLFGLYAYRYYVHGPNPNFNPENAGNTEHHFFQEQEPVQDTTSIDQ